MIGHYPDYNSLKLINASLVPNMALWARGDILWPLSEFNAITVGIKRALTTTSQRNSACSGVMCLPFSLEKNVICIRDGEFLHILFSNLRYKVHYFQRPQGA